MKLLYYLLSLLQIESIDWSYSNQNNWPYDSCKSSKRSPVKIDPSTSTKISSSKQMKSVFLGYTGSQKVQNTGNMIRIQSNLGYIEVGDMNGRRNFNVKFIEFHTESEHEIGGTFFPIEMQIVCTIEDKYWERDESNMAIVSVIIQKGKESFFLNSTGIVDWPKSISKKGDNYTTSITSNVNLNEIVSNTDDYWHYKGTATHPDLRCQEDVLWFIIKDVKEAAEWQVQIIQDLFGKKGNRRDLSNFHPTLYHSSSSLLKFLFSLILVYV